MPIRFRCPYCSKLLGIATRKAGTEIQCPQCGLDVIVPPPAAGTPGDPAALDDIDVLLANDTGAPEPAAPVAPPRAAVAAKPPRPAPAPAPKPKKPGDSLFETGDVDALLGMPNTLPRVTAAPAAPTPAPAAGPKPVSGMDVGSLDPGGGAWVFGPRKAALVVVAVAVLLLVAFGGGFLIASLL